MKHINKYSERKDIPKIGDYVLCYTDSNHEHKDMINNSIGYFDRFFSSYPVIKYDARTKTGKNVTFYAYDYEILHWSKYKQELELILATRKFNI